MNEIEIHLGKEAIEWAVKTLAESKKKLIIGVYDNDGYIIRKKP